MNFFELQDQARRNSARLIVLFALAVAAIIGVVYSLAAFGVALAATARGRFEPIVWWQPATFAWVTGFVLAVIAAGSYYKARQLRQGGGAFARLLGGERVVPNSDDPRLRRLVNIVEEMAIASGTPVPEVYVLNAEPSINAFAAGSTTSDAALGVTRGAVDKLTRDELQGVVAHEFSHILHGDMRLNIRLIGLLHGIQVIALIGLLLLRVSTFRAAGDWGGRTRRGAVLPTLLVGAVLSVVGYVGLFFARLIKAAVSRQREFLADASAVQFTRSQGIAGALKKIGGLTAGSQVRTLWAEEASHMFFGRSGQRSWLLDDLLATHPPLAERIRAIDPSFEGTFPRIEPDYRAPLDAEGAVVGLVRGAASGARSVAAPVTATPEVVMAQVGAPSPAHVAFGTHLLERLPVGLRRSVREPWGARAVVYATLLDPSPELRAAQLDALETEADPAVRDETVHMVEEVDALGPQARLPLLDLALPALRLLSPAQKTAFLRDVERLIAADEMLSLFEYALKKVLLRRLGDPAKRPRVNGTYKSLATFRPELQILLSTVVYAGHGNVEAAHAAFAASVGRLGPDAAGLGMAAPSACKLSTFDFALGRLALLAPWPKESVLSAVAEAVSHDGRITIEEAELVRAIADSLDCPLPPLVV